MNQIIIRISIILFFSELLVMLMIPVFGGATEGWVEVLFDSSLLTLFTAPAIYYWGLAPLRGNKPASTWGFNPLKNAKQIRQNRSSDNDLTLGIVVAVFGVVIFTVESGIMLLIQLFDFNKIIIIKSFFDAILLAAIATPVGYFLIKKIPLLVGNNFDSTNSMSLQKRFFSVFLPILLIITIIGTSIYYVELKRQREVVQLNADRVLTLSEQYLDDFFKEGRFYAVSFSGQKHLQDYLNKEKNKDVLIQNFIDFLQAEQSFSALKILDKTGRIIIDTNFNGYRAYEIHPKPGQKVSEYFQYASSLSYNQVFIYLEPTIEPNTDNKEPYSSNLATTVQNHTIHFSSPLFNAEGKKMGIIVLSANSNIILRDLTRIAEKYSGSLLLKTAQGQVVFHNQQEQINQTGADRLVMSIDIPLNPNLAVIDKAIVPTPVSKNNVFNNQVLKLIKYNPPVSLSQEMTHFTSNILLLFFCFTPLIAGGSAILAQATFVRREIEIANIKTNKVLNDAVIKLEKEMDARYLAEEQLELANEVFQNTTQGIAVTSPEGIIASINPAFTRITGYIQEEVIGHNLRILKSGRHDQKYYELMWGQLLRTGQWRSDIWNRRKNGEIYPQQGNINASRNADGKITHFIYVFSDASKLKQSEEDIHFLINYDVLTKLPNTVLLTERLEQMIDQAVVDDDLVAVLHIDIFRFKRLNDTFGYTEGDNILNLLASRLNALITENDILARKGDDDFAIVTDNIKSIDELNILADKILETLNESFIIDKKEITLTVNIGITVFPLDNSDAKTLLNNANTALARSKEKKNNHFEFFTSEMGKLSAEYLSKENDLRIAIENQEFVLYYQPQFLLKENKFIGVEALIRWPDKEGNLIPPIEFIPLAEETGLIIPLSEWVLKTACLQAKAWQKKGYPPINMSVNISALHLKTEGFVATVKNVLAQTGLEPCYLDLELTESVFMEHVDETINMLNKIKDMGIKMSIDDFGTGYSSLSYLKRFPIHMLKIDQSFVRYMTENTDDVVITETITMLAKNLNLIVIAEGVETPEQLEILRTQGCDMVQGFLFSKPIPAKEMGNVFKHRNKLLELPEIGNNNS
jgi:diguanylate cyclase (GGDEF)-like protein/PAS domain S-box-containing protein